MMEAAGGVCPPLPPPVGGEAPAAQPPPGGLTGDEAELVERLRAKYGGGAAAGQPVDLAEAEAAPPARAAEPPAAAAAAAAAPTNAAAAPSCRICASCLGNGVLVETYEHRRLERCCTECGGEGVVGGSAAGLTAPGPAAAAAPGGVAPAKRHGDAAAADRLAACQQELSELKAGLAGCTDAEELRLRGELAMQLELWCARLRSNGIDTRASGSGDVAASPAAAACH